MDYESRKAKQINQNENTDWWHQMIRLINFYNNDHLDFLSLTQNPLCFLPGAVQLAFSIGKIIIIGIFALKYHPGHEYSNTIVE